MIRILIPELYDGEGRSPFLSQDEQRTFYEKGLRPAIAALCNLPAAEWPVTYNDEMFCARRRNGQLSFTSKMLGAWLVPELADAIRTALTNNGVSWATGLVFLHQIRGVKHSTQHAPNTRSSTIALRQFLDQCKLPWRRISTEGTWFIDTAVEVSSIAGNCLAWRTDSHYNIIRKAVVGLDDDTAERITRLGSSKYARDITSHLPAISGCRVDTQTTRGDHNIVYVQLYTTDKAHTYRPEQGHFGKFITPEDILKKKAPAWIANICTLYNNASDTGSAHARLEVRSGIHHAVDALLGIEETLYRKSLISVPCKPWW